MAPILIRRGKGRQHMERQRRLAILIPIHWVSAEKL